MELNVTVKRHAFSALTVLEDINIRVYDNEITALIGPSGCGKSTLLGIAGGLLKASEGETWLSGTAPPGCLNELTYIFQDFALLPWRTVAQNVAFAIEHHRISVSERHARVADALARTGLSDFAEAYPKQLSGGMRQRVGIARALAVTPAILLMDEPLSALDAQTRDLLLEDFATLLTRERMSGIYVTHHFPEALRLADTIVVLSRRPGRIKEVIEIKIPLADRMRPSARGEMDEIGHRLWSLIRDEASQADREVVDG